MNQESIGDGLPERPSLDQLRKLAKELKASDSLPTLTGAQHALARRFGFESWAKLKLHVEQVTLRRLIQDGDPGPVATLLKENPRLADLPFVEGEKPLHVAAEENRPAIVELLVRHGAKLSDRYGGSAHTALSWALTTWSFDAAEKLVDLGDEPDLFCASGLGRLDLVRKFWVDGRLVPRPSKTGSSRLTPDFQTRLPCPPESDMEQLGDALYIACRTDRFEVAKWLVEHGADPNFRGYIGGTCLMWAEFSGNAVLAKLLREHGGSDELRDYAFQATPNEFPMMVLAGWGFRDLLAKRLQEDAGQLRIQTPFGTPLHAAASGGHGWVVEALLLAGLDKAVRNESGQTAADLAEARGHLEVAALLNKGS